MFCFNDDSYLFLCFLFINLLKMTSISLHLASTFNSTLCMVLYLMSKWWIVCFKIVFEVVVHYEKDNLFIRFSNFPSISKFHIMKLKQLYAIFNTNVKSVQVLHNQVSSLIQKRIQIITCTQHIHFIFSNNHVAVWNRHHKEMSFTLI